MNAHAFAQTFWGVIGLGGASDSSRPTGITTAAAAAILGPQNVFSQDAYVQVFSVGRPPRHVPESVPFSGKQLIGLHEASGGKLRLFLRYASLAQVMSAASDDLRIDEGVIDLMSELERTIPSKPMYRLVSSGLLQEEEADLRRVAKGFGLGVAHASVTTGVTAVLLQMLREDRPISYQSLGQKEGRQVVVGAGSGIVNVHLAQTLRTFPPILEFRARG